MGCPALENTYGSTPYYVTGMLRQKKKNGPNERTDQSSRKNTTKWQRDSQPIRCIVQNTGNQDAHRIGWVWSQNRGKTEGYEKWNKGKCIGNQHWREGNLNSNQRFGAEGRNKHSTRTEWRNKKSKSEERLRNLWDNYKCSNIWIIGVSEGKEQEIENLFENVMKELP